MLRCALPYLRRAMLLRGPLVAAVSEGSFKGVLAALLPAAEGGGSTEPVSR